MRCNLGQIRNLSSIILWSIPLLLIGVLVCRFDGSISRETCAEAAKTVGNSLRGITSELVQTGGTVCPEGSVGHVVTEFPLAHQ